MKQLAPTEERLVEDFAWQLYLVDGVDDIFPPDATCVREPRRPILPVISGREALVFVPVYDLDSARRNRRTGAAILEAA
jgi:hypothetical protein